MWYMWGNVCISLACDLLSIFHTVFIFPYLIITVLEYKIYYFFYLKTKNTDVELDAPAVCRFRIILIS